MTITTTLRNKLPLNNLLYKFNTRNNDFILNHNINLSNDKIFSELKITFNLLQYDDINVARKIKNLILSEINLDDDHIDLIYYICEIVSRIKSEMDLKSLKSIFKKIEKFSYQKSLDVKVNELEQNYIQILIRVDLEKYCHDKRAEDDINLPNLMLSVANILNEKHF